MAYKVEITPPRCQTCGGGAKQTVYNSRNASVGEFCNPCANRKVKELEAAENARGAGDDPREHRG
jgi:hypothetical protein